MTYITYITYLKVKLSRPVSASAASWPGLRMLATKMRVLLPSPSTIACMARVRVRVRVRVKVRVRVRVRAR